MNHAARIVERVAMHRQARMAGRAKGPQHVDEAAIERDGDDVGARNHDVLDLNLMQGEDVLQHGALLRRNIDLRRRIGERILNVVADRGAAETEHGAQAVEQAGPCAAAARSDPASPAAGLSRSLMSRRHFWACARGAA